MKNFVSKVSTFMALAGSMILPASVLAVSPIPDPATQQEINITASEAGFKIDDLTTFIQSLLNTVLIVAALLVFIYLIWGGIQWITSGGDKGKTEEARNKITAAIIGLAVVASAYVIFLVVAAFLGIPNPFSGSFTLPTAY